MKKILVGDEVIVLTGKDKGKHGQVKCRVREDYVLVQGVNIVKKAMKPNAFTGARGGIIDKLMPIHVSNIALFNVKSGKKDRPGSKVIDAKKVRVFRSDGEMVKVR